MDNFFKIDLSELGPEVINKADKFAKDVVEETFDRFSYNKERRIEVLKIGKLAEEVFARFIKSELGITLSVNYDIYPGVENADSEDFEIWGLNVDIKSSKDTKNEGIESCHSRFNFPVPSDQKIKDLTFSIIYDFDVKSFYIVSWIDKKTYSEGARIGKLNVGGGIVKEFYLYPLASGRNIKDFGGYIKENGKKEKL